MNGSENTYEKIERYLRGGMEGDELLSFERELREDNDLKNEVDLHKNIQDFLADKETLHLRTELEKAGAATPAPANVVPIRRFIWMAASVLVIAVTAYFILQNTKPSPAKIFARNFEPYQMVLSSRSNDPTAETLNAAINAYTQNDFEKAASYFTTLINGDSASRAFIFYRGICLLARNEMAQARADLEKLKENGASLLFQQAGWYIALSYIGEDDKENACLMLNRIREQSYKQNEIKKILDQLCD